MFLSFDYSVIVMGKLECSGLTKVYSDHRKALDNVSFSVETKGIFGLIGRNGAGKTTLIRILSTELAPTSGTAHINNLNILKQEKQVREKIAIVPQEARAIRWMTPQQTIMSYLLWRGYSRKDAKTLAEASLKKLQIDQYANILNSKLSGGTKRKVLIATVTASEAEIIFLDEPTTGLDPISRRELWEILKTLGKERFIFLTTHYLEEAEQLADKIGILKDGQLISIGSLSELRSSSRYQYSIKLASYSSCLSWNLLTAHTYRGDYPFCCINANVCCLHRHRLHAIDDFKRCHPKLRVLKTALAPICHYTASVLPDNVCALPVELHCLSFTDHLRRANYACSHRLHRHLTGQLGD